MAKSYLLYQKYQKIGQTGNWIPVYPLEYSYNADGTMMPVTKNNNDPACGAAQPIYRWVETEQYECVYEADPTPTPYEEQYFTIESLEDGNEIRFGSYDMGAMTVSASTDNGQTWSAFTANDSEVTIATVNNGGKVLFKGQNERYYPTYGFGSNVGSFITSNSKSLKVYGNIMSLVSGDTFTTATSVSSYAFKFFFAQTFVADASNLILPATTLANSCYASMFYGCTELTTAPELPATTLAEYCYSSMFYECTSLTTAPSVLPATTLANRCYDYMFHSCTSLTTAPELPATTLAEYCYSNMFHSCTSLNYVKCLATDISASNCTNRWLYGVAANGTFVKNPNMSSWTTGVSGIPTGWTVQDA